MNAFDKIANILKELSGIEVINFEDKLQSDLALDSMAMVTLLIEIEDAFGFELNESDMNPFDLITVQDVVDLAERYLGEKSEKG